MYPETGELKQVTYDDPGVYDYASYPEWSPQGDRIAFIYSRGIGVVDVMTRAMSHVVDAPSAGMDYLRWSPDGRYLLYANDDTYLYDFSANSTSAFLDEPGLACWSPDGEKVAFIPYSSAFKEHKTLKVLDAMSRSTLYEIRIPGYERKLDWSPDGNWISLGFSGDFYFGQTLYLTHAETGKILSINFSNELTYLYQPCWTEDMSRIVFDGTERNGGGASEIWAITMPTDLE